VLIPLETLSDLLLDSILVLLWDFLLESARASDFLSALDWLSDSPSGWVLESDWVLGSASDSTLDLDPASGSPSDWLSDSPSGSPSVMDWDWVLVMDWASGLDPDSG
jgi:hypothetical protein